MFSLPGYSPFSPCSLSTLSLFSPEVTYTPLYTFCAYRFTINLLNRHNPTSPWVGESTGRGPSASGWALWLPGARRLVGESLAPTVRTETSPGRRGECKGLRSRLPHVRRRPAADVPSVTSPGRGNRRACTSPAPPTPGCPPRPPPPPPPHRPAGALPAAPIIRRAVDERRPRPRSGLWVAGPHSGALLGALPVGRGRRAAGGGGTQANGQSGTQARGARGGVGAGWLAVLGLSRAARHVDAHAAPTHVLGPPPHPGAGRGPGSDPLRRLLPVVPGRPAGAHHPGPGGAPRARAPAHRTADRSPAKHLHDTTGHGSVGAPGESFLLCRPLSVL